MSGFFVHRIFVPNMALRSHSNQRRAAICISLLLAIAAFLRSWPGVSGDRDVIAPEMTAERKSAASFSAHLSDQSRSTQHGRHGSDSVDDIYDADAPLATQLHTLRALSDNRDPYATCVLAWALDLCARGTEHVSISEYYDADMKNLDDKSINDIAMFFEYRQRRATLCSGLVETDLWDIDQRLLQSARMGHVRSMTLLAQFPARAGSGLDTSTASFLQAHREHAEDMLNRAAEAGDPAAIRETHDSYGRGYIISSLGDIKVEIDLAKSIAALQAISLHANQEDRKELDQVVADAVAKMSPRQRLRFERLAAAYSRAYLGKRGAEDQLQRAFDEFPEKVCAGKAAFSARPPGAE